MRNPSGKDRARKADPSAAGDVSSGSNHTARLEPLLDSPFVDSSLVQHAEYLLRAGVAGTSTSHGAEDNLYKIDLLLKHDDSTTFGMEESLCRVASRKPTRPSPTTSATRRTRRRIRGVGV